MDDLNSEAQKTEPEGRIIDQEAPPREGQEHKQPRKTPPNLKQPLPPIPAAGMMVPPEMVKLVYLLRRQMEEDPLSVPLEAWVWEKNYTLTHPSRKLGKGGYRRKAKHNEDSDEFTEEFIDAESEKHRRKPKLLREVNGLIKIVTKRLDSRETNETKQTTQLIKEATGLVAALGGVIKDLAGENKQHVTDRMAYEEQLRRQAEELRKYAEGLPNSHPMKTKILEALGVGAKLFLPKLTELAKLAGIDIPKMGADKDDDDDET